MASNLSPRRRQRSGHSSCLLLASTLRLLRQLHSILIAGQDHLEALRDGRGSNAVDRPLHAGGHAVDEWSIDGLGGEGGCQGGG